MKYGGTSALNQTVPSVFAAFRVMTAMQWRFISRTTVVGQGFSRYFDNGFVLVRDYYGLYGLYSSDRDLGKSVFVYVKEKLRGDNIFMPIAWEEED